MTTDVFSDGQTVRARDLIERETSPAMPGTPKTIMIIVRSRLFRDGIRRVLERVGQAIIQDCETIAHVAQALETLPPPDLFVIGIDGSEPSSMIFADIRAMKLQMPTARWIIVSQHADLVFARDAVETNIDGMVLEDSPCEVLQLLTELVLLGHSFVPTRMARMLSEGDDIIGSGLTLNHTPKLQLLTRESQPKTEPVPSRPPRVEVIPEGVARPIPEGEARPRRLEHLSDRESEIVRCLVLGHSNKIIARDLKIAEATVKVHVKGLLRKMQVTNRTQAAIRAWNELHAQMEPEKAPASSETARWGADLAYANGRNGTRIHATDK